MAVQIFPISASRLVHPIVIQVRTRTQSDDGEITEGWATLTETWAEILPIIGGRNIEIAAARTKGRSASHQFNMRFPGLMLVPDLHRFEFENRIFEIFAVADIQEKHLELDCIANEKVS